MISIVLVKEHYLIMISTVKINKKIHGKTKSTIITCLKFHNNPPKRISIYSKKSNTLESKSNYRQMNPPKMKSKKQLKIFPTLLLYNYWVKENSTIKLFKKIHPCFQHQSQTLNQCQDLWKYCLICLNSLI